MVKKQCNFDNAHAQHSSLPLNIIYLLRKNLIGSPKVILKLYQTCKYFYFKQNLAFFDKICYNDGYGGYYINRQQMDKRPPRKFKDSVLLISLNNTLIISSLFPSFLNETKTMKWFPNITILSLQRMALKFEEFEIVISINTIKDFSLRDSSITFSSNNSVVPMNVVLEKLPNVECFKYDNKEDLFPLEDLKKLNAMKLKNKFKVFHITIYKASESFDADLFCKFLENNVYSRGVGISEVQIDTFFRNEIKKEALRMGIYKLYREKGKMSTLFFL
uniref:Uncharacterized protein n=1 Tax=Panagrolaimus davidi TaxID=227884 RepID=A0A914QYN8_9BILA